MSDQDAPLSAPESDEAKRFRAELASGERTIVAGPARKRVTQRQRCQWHDTEFIEIRAGEFCCVLCAQDARAPLSAPVERKGPMACSICGKPATCIGVAEGRQIDEPACDECCGHGDGDGRCWELLPQDSQVSAPVERQALIDEAERVVNILEEIHNPEIEPFKWWAGLFYNAIQTRRREPAIIEAEVRALVDAPRLVRQLIAALGVVHAGTQEQENLTRVDRERRAAGPTGSIAASNEEGSSK